MELRKVVPVGLRELGVDERWLQDRIKDDPTILGLGDIEIVSREHRQPVGGRIDFLMRDENDESYYEVEVMLGALDESHIIRTFEYWDIERQRRPLNDHTAVIVAEQITTRFFNVLRLLNRAVPVIAVQLTAFRMDDNTIGLLPVTVLDVIEEITDTDIVDDAEQADRAFWEKKSSAASLSVMDKTIALLRSANADPRITYNRGHIAVATTGYNFCWFHPRRIAPHCLIQCRLGADRDAVVSSLQAQGVDASPKGSKDITMTVTDANLNDHSAAILAALKQAETFSRR